MNIQDCLEKSLKIKFVLKSAGKTLKEDLTVVFGDLNQYQIVVPLFGAAYAAQNKSTTILYYLNFRKLLS